MADEARTLWFGLKFSGLKVNSKFVRGQSTEPISSLLSKEVADDLLIEKVFATKSCSNASDENNNAIECDIRMPLGVVADMGMKFLEVHVVKRANDGQRRTDGPNIFTVMMSMMRKYDKLPPKRSNNNHRDKVYNKVIDTLDAYDVKFNSHQVDDLGQKTVQELTDVLWSLDPFHEKFAARSIRIPEPFSTFHGYNDWKRQHKKEPQVTQTELERLSDSIFKLMSSPYMMADRVDRFRKQLDQLHCCILKYLTYLKDMNIRVSAAHESSTPVRSVNDSWAFEVKEGGENDVPACYKSLIKDLDKHSVYEPVDLLDYEPEDSVKRQTWLKNLKLPYAFGIFTYSHGNHLGKLTVIRKQPIVSERIPSEDIRIINDIKNKIPTFATRAMRREFMETYAKLLPVHKPAVLRSMYRYLTGHTFAPENATQEQVDERVTKFLLASDDPKLVTDLRKNNGRIKDPKFDTFWKELKTYLDEISVVHERRDGNHMYMPFAISTADLRQQILDRCPEGTHAPSVSWISLNFMPQNPFKESALKYTGEFNVKHKVQQRLLRAKHVDSEYAYIQFTYLKQFAVEWRENALMQCLDDKAIVPVGEPDKPTAAVQRKHHGGLVVGEGSQLLALDHDYNLCGIVPSVCLCTEIPTNPRESFYHGDVHVTLKEKVLQPSSPLRHSTETVKITRSYNEDDVNSPKPILLRYTDGGPDHRTTYQSVQVAAITEFVALDLDLFIACRTAPNQSYNNPAERIMSLLNLGLQNVSLARSRMELGHEIKIKSLNSLKAFRNNANNSLKTALTDSMKEPVNAVKNIFSRLRRSHGEVIVHDAASDQEIDDMKDMLKLVDPDLTADCQKPLDSPKMKDFYQRHCRARHYSFQIKKCTPEDAEQCPYCALNPPRLPPADFARLTFLPDPVKDAVTGSFKDFHCVVGTPTTDADMPSKLEKPGPTERDKKLKSLLVAGKVRQFVMCHECGKRRVVYSAARLDAKELRALTVVQDHLLYSCGSCLFPGGEYQDTIIVREGLNCSSPIETQYYADLMQKFDEICYYCGDTDVDNSPEIMQMREQYSIVRPLCSSCSKEGLKPCTRNAKRLKKK